VTLAPLAGLEEAREAWCALSEHTGNVFSSWEWASIWWRHFGAGRALRLAALREGSRCVAILPLYLERRRGVRLIRFLGHGVGDELQPVCGPDSFDVAGRALAAIAGTGDVLLAERLPGGRAWDRLLRGRLLKQESSPVIDLVETGEWDDYLAGRSSNFRQQVRRRGKRLRNLGVTFRLTTDADRLERDFSVLIALNRARWGRDARAFEGPREAFHREFAAQALTRGWLRLWLAEAEGTPVAAWYGFRFAGVESYYQSGRDPSWDRFAVGAGILEHSIREALADGMREYRLLRGNEDYKARYATRGGLVCTFGLPSTALGTAAVALVASLSGSEAWRRLLRPLVRD